jgi:RNase P/RNase MRP subunit p30
MFTDIVFPSGNEDEFVVMAKRLGSNLVFMYDKIPQDQIVVLREKYPLVKFASWRGKADVILGKPEDVERKDVAVIVGLEGDEKRDGLHERKTNVDTAFCKKAKDKLLCFDFGLLLTSKDQPLILGRMQQNADLFRKYKNNVIIASLARSPSEMRQGRDYHALLREFGYDGKEAKRIVEKLAVFLQEQTR